MRTLGTVIENRFKIVKIIGEGVSGIVYEAFDSRTSTFIALKIVRKLFKLNKTVVHSILRFFARSKSSLSSLCYQRELSTT